MRLGIVTNSVSISTSATSFGCSVVISASRPDVVDGGYLDIMKCNRNPDFSSKECLELLQKSWKPPLGYAFPYRPFGDKQRRCSSDWLSRYNFLRYSKRQDGVVCVYCYFFRPNDVGALISSPLSDLKNIGALLEKHIGDVQTSLHSKTMKKAETFTGVATGQQSDIITLVSSSRWRKYVYVVKCA